jgi:RNA-binding protein
MLTSKQRAKLRAIASQENTILQVGKGGINDELIKQVRDALLKRELIKMRTLETSSLGVGEAAEFLAESAEAEVVHTLGSTFVLYKRNPKKPVIEL